MGQTPKIHQMDGCTPNGLQPASQPGGGGALGVCPILSRWAVPSPGVLAPAGLAGPQVDGPMWLAYYTYGEEVHRSIKSLMLQSHQKFRVVPVVRLLRIMLRNGCWLTTFHTITTKDADGWCQN